MMLLVRNISMTATTATTEEEEYAWLCEVSGLAADETTEEDRRAVHAAVRDSGMAVCALDCADGELYYQVLGAWCVPWQRVPKAQFLKAWFALPAARRGELVAERKVFAEELDCARWCENMWARDDADMLAADAVLSEMETSESRGAMLGATAAAAVRCVEWLAARHGWLDGKWMLTVRDIDNAAGAGGARMMRLFVERGGAAPSRSACAAAAAAGNLECLAYLHERVGCAWDWVTCMLAAQAGHLECLAYAHEHGCEWDAHYTVCVAAKEGHADCLRYVDQQVDGDYGHNLFSVRALFEIAAVQDHTECMEYIRNMVAH